MIPVKNCRNSLYNYFLDYSEVINKLATINSFAVITSLLLTTSTRQDRLVSPFYACASLVGTIAIKFFARPSVLNPYKENKERNKNDQELIQKINAFKDKKIFCFNKTISKIPDCIDQLSDVECLLFADTKISEIPESILNLSKLETLILSNNNISQIPDWLLKLPQTCSVNLTGNHIPKKEIERFEEKMKQTNYKPNFKFVG